MRGVALTPQLETMETKRRQNKIAVVIPAFNEARRIAATVRACRALPGVDLLIVVDDGSDDNTQDYARQAGAVVVRHSVNRGKASAMETGTKVAAMRDLKDGLPRHILFLDADLGETAVEATALIEILQASTVDCVVASMLNENKETKPAAVVRLARKAIGRATGWKPLSPTSGQRLLTREAVEAALPFADGWGVETGMTIDLLRAGYSIQEVPCDFTHRDAGDDIVGTLHRGDQYKDVFLASLGRKISALKQFFAAGGRTHARELREAIRLAATSQAPGKPYQLVLPE